MKIELEKEKNNVVKMNIEFPAKDAVEAYNRASMRISQHIIFRVLDVVKLREML